MRSVEALSPRIGPIRSIVPRGPFSLSETCAPVAWARGRWPNVDWRDGRFVWVGYEGEETVWRTVSETGDGELRVSGTGAGARDGAWAASVLGLDTACPPFVDGVVEGIRRRLGGLRPFTYGSLFDGLQTSIVGQSISVAAAAVTETRLSMLFHPGLELAGRRFWPLPRPDQLARTEPAFVRRCGVTWRRAEALVEVGRAAEEGVLPGRAEALHDPTTVREALRRLPLVGPWTVESALLWGVGLDDAYPTGDVALLRAARLAYEDDGLDRVALDRLAERWRPSRGWAARLLWTALLGTADAQPTEKGRFG